MYRIKDRLAREEGFTLIELLVVVAIIGILLAIAVPSYLGFKDSANQRAAQADVRAAIPSAEQFYADNGTYAGMTTALLRGFDSGLAQSLVIDNLAAGSYCLEATTNGKVAHVTRPPIAADGNGAVLAGACP